MGIEIEEKIKAIIDGIDNPGITIKESGYGKWLIVFTNIAIYFVKISNSTSVINPFGLIGQVIEIGIKQALSDGKDSSNIDKNNLVSILNNSKKHYKITRNLLDKIEIKDSFISGKAILLKGFENNILTIAVKKGQLEAFKNEYDKCLREWELIK